MTLYIICALISALIASYAAVTRRWHWFAVWFIIAFLWIGFMPY